MDLQAAFRARLLGNSAIAALTTKIAWGGLPQSATLPYVRLTKAGPGREWTHEGPIPLVNPRVQIDVFGANAAQASALAAAIQAEMERLDPVTAGGWEFLPPGMIALDRGPDVEDMAGGGQTHRIMHDYSFWAQPA